MDERDRGTRLPFYTHGGVLMAKTSTHIKRFAKSLSVPTGRLPGLSNPATTGPLVREAQRHLAQWMLQPIAASVAEECSTKLGSIVTLDVMRPLQAFDAGGRARAAAGIVQILTQAKESGVDPDIALKLVDWEA